jgi:site-specific recombinase XerD
MADGVVTDTAVGAGGGSLPSALVSVGRTFPAFGVVSAAGDAEQIFARPPTDAREARRRGRLVLRRPARGLRADEIVRLRAGDSDGTQMIIRIVQSKGRNDRPVMLPPEALALLRQ